jgi:hypothetical protein
MHEYQIIKSCRSFLIQNGDARVFRLRRELIA